MDLPRVTITKRVLKQKHLATNPDCRSFRLRLNRTVADTWPSTIFGFENALNYGFQIDTWPPTRIEPSGYTPASEAVPSLCLET